MLGSMAQQIPNPTAQGPNDVFFTSSSITTEMVEDCFGSVYTSPLLHTVSSNLCSKNPDNLPTWVCVSEEPSVDFMGLRMLGVKRNSIYHEIWRSMLPGHIFQYYPNKEITIRVASCAISTIMALHTSVLLCNLPLFRNHLPLFLFPVEELQKEHGFRSILIPMLELFSYMVLVSAVASIILLRAKFTRMHSVWFFSWSILMIAESDNPINALYLTLLGIFFIWWYAVCSWKSSNQMQGQKLSGTVEPESSHDLHP
ncbi:hypothetical protein HN51_006049 [Arachis hypogaea]|uniref:Uncharacterized protein n=1 Tax=Arachis hypogaea TaxID=3818 RepID=A0A445DCA1_ARAHY|nr:uncharacterized protein LOC112797645 [Arachis hypogaea]RYR60819.1 hypothetical protein Ahy_A04g017885 [Arachis hypogaea]